MSTFNRYFNRLAGPGCFLLALCLAGCVTRAHEEARPSAAETGVSAGAATSSAAATVKGFTGALAGARVVPIRANLTYESGGGVLFVATGSDPQIIITPSAAIAPAKTSRFVVTVELLDVPVGEFALFYRTRLRDFDGDHYLYATKWEPQGGKTARLTYDMRLAKAGAKGWAQAPVTALRFDPVDTPTGQVRIDAFEPAP